ncbi:MAG: hypothetical protein R3D67_10210 [Hyphomicrobiaceae bacterium]
MLQKCADPALARWLASVLVFLTIAQAPAAAGDGGALATSRVPPAHADEARDELAAVTKYIRSLAVAPGRGVVGAMATDVGHWRLANRSGERFTAANKDELARAFEVLAPEASGEAARLAIYVDPNTLYRHASQLRALPHQALTWVVGRAKAYRLIALTDTKDRKFAIEFDANLLLAARDQSEFDEMAWQLSRPLQRASVRTLRLAPAGPTGIARLPTIDAANRRAEPDLVDPGHVGAGLASLTGQMVLISGQWQGARLVFTPESGASSSLGWTELEGAARRNDVNLIVVGASSPRQPGTRNWLWQTATLSNVDAAVAQSQLGAFLVALAGDGPLVVRLKTAQQASLVLEVLPQTAHTGRPTGPLDSLTDVVTGKLSELVSQTSGRIAVERLDLVLPTRARQAELDRRLVKWLPSNVQFTLAAILAAGLASLPVLLGWWHSIWPPEVRNEYAHATGYVTARLARWLIFAAVFVPLAALPAMAVLIQRLMRGAVGREQSRRATLEGPAELPDGSQQ